MFHVVREEELCSTPENKGENGSALGPMKLATQIGLSLNRMWWRVQIHLIHPHHPNIHMIPLKNDSVE